MSRRGGSKSSKSQQTVVPVRRGKGENEFKMIRESLNESENENERESKNDGERRRNDEERVVWSESEMNSKLKVRFSRGSAGPFLYNLFLFEGRMKLRVCMKNSRDCGVREAPNICPPNFYTAYTEGGFISKEKTKIDEKERKLNNERSPTSDDGGRVL